MKGQEKYHGEIRNKCTKGIKKRKKLFCPSSLMGHVLVVI
jgi:hypothetical protein